MHVYLVKTLSITYFQGIFPGASLSTLGKNTIILLIFKGYFPRVFFQSWANYQSILNFQKIIPKASFLNLGKITLALLISKGYPPVLSSHFV